MIAPAQQATGPAGPAPASPSPVQTEPAGELIAGLARRVERLEAELADLRAELGIGTHDDLGAEQQGERARNCRPGPASKR